MVVRIGISVKATACCGAAITAACGPSHIDLVRSPGVAEIIDHRAGDFTQHAGEYDLMFDAVDKIITLAGAGVGTQERCISISEDADRRENRVPGAVERAAI